MTKKQIKKSWYHEIWQVTYAFWYLFIGWMICGQIKKTQYKRYDQCKGKEKKLTEIGHCYCYFFSRMSAKGFRIPFTLRTKKVR